MSYTKSMPHINSVLHTKSLLQTKCLLHTRSISHTINPYYALKPSIYMRMIIKPVDAGSHIVFLGLALELCTQASLWKTSYETPPPY